MADLDEGELDVATAAVEVLLRANSELKSFTQRYHGHSFKNREQFVKERIGRLGRLAKECKAAAEGLGLLAAESQQKE